MRASRRASRWTRPLAIALCLLVLAACGGRGSKGPKGKPGDPGPPGDPGSTPTELLPTQDAPQVILEVVELSGGSGVGGAFRPGDFLTVTFTAEKEDGSSWALDEFDRLRMLVSGPTFNYQRVLAEVSDAPEEAVANADGSFTYTFADPLPETYLPPYNDTEDFGPDDGELAGQPLLDGTYTLGMYARWPYTVGSDSFREIGNTTYDFLVGDAPGPLTSRELVTQANCNSCHSELQAHGGQRRDVTLCLMCHTNGSEDRNVPGAAGGTPGASVAMGTMIHKIHNGGHLPSVLGIGVSEFGGQTYDETPVPYQLVGFGDSVHDFSEVMFPVWPNLSEPMPVDEGYSALGGDEQALADQVLTGVTACGTCHGDPDGDGPLPAPAQGALAYQFPTRRGCTSCHDDWDPERLYKVNTFSGMAPQANDASCTVCHPADGGPLAVIDAHLHPLLDESYNPGLNFTIADVSGAGFLGDPIGAGDRVSVTFTVTDDAGAAVDPGDIASMNVALVGPTSNMQSVLYGAFPTAALSGAQPYTLNLPQLVQYEFLGLGTSDPDAFGTSRTPLWDDMGVPSTVRVITGLGADDALAADVAAQQNYIDLLDSTGFARDDVVVIDAGEDEEEYLVVQFVDGDRLWFSSPYSTGYPAGTRVAHLADATVDVALTPEEPLTLGDDYTVSAGSGTITEVGDSFADGFAVLVSYTTDFVMPEAYGLTLNDSPDLGEAEGQWLGLELLGGTYRLQLWGYRNVAFELQGEDNSYRGASDDEAYEFLVGDATSLEPWELVSGAENCYSCHSELRFHGASRAGFDTCLSCHGLAGAEDRPQYVAGNAPATTGVDIGFREMLHKIHAGSELAAGDAYVVVGFGPPNLYPKNFSEHTYDEVVFPAMPDGAKACAQCHGADNEAWQEPAPRNHPDQTVPTGSWTRACGACHDDDAAQAHLALNTASSGVEACATCHGEGKQADVSVAHKVR